MVEGGLDPELLLGSRYGHHLHVWNLRSRKHVQAMDLGKQNQIVLELRPAHDPTKAYGFAGVTVSLEDLSASVWLWHRDDGAWAITKVIEVPAEPADPDQLPPLLKDFKAVPPLITDIILSLDDRRHHHSRQKLERCTTNPDESLGIAITIPDESLGERNHHREGCE
jgi:methanethiol oxidase